MFAIATNPLPRATRIEKKQDDFAAFDAIANKLLPEARKAFYEALRQIGARVNLEELAKAVAAGAVRNIQLILPKGIDVTLVGAARVINDAMQQAGGVAAKRVGARLGVQMRFDMVNPEAVAQAEQFAGDLIRYVDTATKLNVRNLINHAFAEGIPPKIIAKQIGPLVGLLPQHALAVQRRREKMIAAGYHPSKVEKAAQDYTKTLLRYRAEMIARQEIMRAQNEGQRQLWRQAQAAGLLPPGTLQRWIVTDDDRLCPRCLQMEGQMTSLDGYFVGNGPDGQEFYQVPQDIHPQCRCRTVIVIPDMPPIVQPLPLAPPAPPATANPYKGLTPEQIAAKLYEKFGAKADVIRFRDPFDAVEPLLALRAQLGDLAVKVRPAGDGTFFIERVSDGARLGVNGWLVPTASPAAPAPVPIARLNIPQSYTDPKDIANHVFNQMGRVPGLELKRDVFVMDRALAQEVVDALGGLHVNLRHVVGDKWLVERTSDGAKFGDDGWLGIGAAPKPSKPNLPTPVGATTSQRLADLERAIDDLLSDVKSDTPMGGNGNVNETRKLELASGAKGVFKPEDGENFKSRRGSWIRDSVTNESFTLAQRERLSYLVDQALGTDLVPRVVYRQDANGRIGSLMEFAPSGSVAQMDYYGSGLTNDQKARMFLLDTLIGNTDRHPGNWMRTPTGEPIAIDHGYVFPSMTSTDPLGLRELRTYQLIDGWNYKPPTFNDSLVENTIRRLESTDWNRILDTAPNMNKSEREAFLRRVDFMIERLGTGTLMDYWKGPDGGGFMKKRR